MFSLYPLIGQYLSGTTASSLFEAKLGYEEMKEKEVHIYAPAYRKMNLMKSSVYATILFLIHFPNGINTRIKLKLLLKNRMRP